MIMKYLYKLKTFTVKLPSNKDSKSGHLQALYPIAGKLLAQQPYSARFPS